MKFDELKYQIGLDRPVTIGTNNDEVFFGVLSEVTSAGLFLVLEDGRKKWLSQTEIREFYRNQIVNNRPESQNVVDWINKQANRLVDIYNSVFQSYCVPAMKEAANRLREGTAEEKELAQNLLFIDQFKHQYVVAGEAERLCQIAECSLADDPELSRWICFLLWYGAGSPGKSMGVLTGALMPEDGEQAQGLYRQLALANRMIGRADAMSRFWLSRYFLNNPQDAIAQNSICCSELWIAYLDLSVSFDFFQNIPEILEAIRQLGTDTSKRCLANSLARLFSQMGRLSFAREAAAQLERGSGMEYRDLTYYLRSDEDGYCYFAAQAAEKILRECREQKNKVICYDGDSSVLRTGYLYNFTSGRRFGHLLGYDLLTYFMPALVLDDNKTREKEIRESFNLSRYVNRRSLMHALNFRAENTNRRGPSYTVIEIE